MKKGILTFIVLSCMTISVFAQGISLGPIAGATYSTIKGSAAEGSSEKEQYSFGTQFGVGVNIGVNEMFSIQPEFIFSQQGGKIENEVKNFTTIFKNNFINLPVLAKLTFGKEEGVKVFAVAGPYAGYWLSGKTEEDDGQTVEKFDVVFNSEDNRFDYGFVFGAGLGFPVGPGSLNLDLRYNLGLADLDKTEISDLSNRVASASLSYLINLGGK